METKLIKLFEKVQSIPYKVCKYNEKDIDENLKEGDCRHKHFLLKNLLEKEGFQVKEFKVIFNWRDLPIPEKILSVLNGKTLFDHSSLKVKVGKKWLKVDCTWNPELKEKGFPVTENWNGLEDTNLVTKGKIKYVDKRNFSRDKFGINFNKEDVHIFAEKLNRWICD